MKSFIKKQQFNYIKRCLFDLNNAFINCSDPNIINVSKLIAQDKSYLALINYLKLKKKYLIFQK